MILITAFSLSRKTFIQNVAQSSLAAMLEDKDYYVWVDIEGSLSEDVNLLRTIFHFDELTIEDCLHEQQLPKLETFEEYHFFILQGVSSYTQDIRCRNVELDGYLGDRYLVTVHEDPIPAISQSIRNIDRNCSRLAHGTAYLTYEILDPMIDMYLPVLDYLDERIRQLTSEVHEQFADNAAINHMNLSSHILELRRVASRNERVFYQFSHSSLQFIDPDEARLFRDIHDHMLRVLDLSEYYQHSLHEALNIQLSLNSNRMNQVVQFLTLWATIMLPLNVMTGIYGMNFHFMPFLESPYGFWLIISIMLVLVVGLLSYFKRRGWI